MTMPPKPALTPVPNPLRRGFWSCVLVLISAIAARADEAPSRPALPGLPPDPLVMAAIAATPHTELARLNWQTEQALGPGLRAGPHEWSARAAIQRRTERNGGRWVEHEVGLERAIRMGDKASLDGRLADAGVAAALSGYEDAWHESARSLMKAWFELAREDHAVDSLAMQTTLAGQQLAVVRRRVAAGDAPRLEALLAQGELDRVEANLVNARQRAAFVRIEFERRYPLLQGLGWQPKDLAPGDPADHALATDTTTLENTILAENHEIELAKAQTALARLRAARADRDRHADPVIGMRVVQERGGQDTVVGLSIAIPFGSVARDARSQAAALDATKAEVRERDVLTRVGYEATQVARSVAPSQAIARQLTASARLASTAADLAAKAYAEGEMPLGNVLQARRQAGESLLSAALARISAHEALARALLDAHHLWPPATPDTSHRR